MLKGECSKCQYGSLPSNSDICVECGLSRKNYKPIVGTTCKCYCAEKNFLGKIGVCWGTKECEACSCGGDESKCDFYEDKRKKAAPKTTNSDRIRAMTDEELADFIGGIFTTEYDIWGDYDPKTIVTQEPRVEVRSKEDMLEWLKQEAYSEGGGNK